MNPVDAIEDNNAPTKDECNMAMLIHILALVAGFIGPLVLWAVKRNESKFIDRHGKACLNMEITFVIAIVALYLVLFIPIILLSSSMHGNDFGGWAVGFIIGSVVLLLLAVFLRLIFPIIAAVRASRGEEYTYPLSIRFIK